MDQPNNNGRKSDGTFAAGNDLGGRTRGSLNKTTLAVRALLEGEAEELTRAAIDKAKDGDTAALRLCIERLAPAPKDAPVSFNLPPVKTAQDAVVASSALLAAVASGEVTPDEGARIMNLLTSHKAVLEAGDLEARIAALEEKNG